MSRYQLEPEIAAFVRHYEESSPLSDAEARDPAAFRARYRRVVAEIESPRPAGVGVEDAAVAANGLDIPVRAYRVSESPGQRCCLFFHGGGWMLGDLDTHDAWAADLAVAAGATVIAVDYRLGPEQPYPAALDDCWAVLREVAGDPGRWGIDPARIAVTGDSAGGNLAAALALRARDAGGPQLAGQVLVYPALHYGEPLPSWEENRDAPILTLESLHACWRAYLRRQTPDAGAAPLLAERFDGLAPAWIVTAEHDPLRDDGLVYAERLRQAGVAVALFDVPGLVHGCFRVRHTSDITRRAFEFSVEGLRSALGIRRQ